MNDSDVLNRNRIIIVTLVIVFALLIIIWLFGYFIKSDRKVENIALSYLPISYNSDGEDIKIDDEDRIKIYDYINDLKLSLPVQATIDIKYKIQIGNDTYLVGDGSAIIKNDETYEVGKGIDELVDYLDKKIEDIDRVYVYTVDEMYNFTKVELTDEDKLAIRDAWKNQDKKVEHIELAIEESIAIVIDDEVLQGNAQYFEYKDGLISLGKELSNIVNRYTVSCDNEGIVKEINYEIKNDLDSLNSNYNKRGVYADIPKCSGASVTYKIASGEKSSDGYSINIDRIELDEDDNAIVYVKENSPESIYSVADILTYPIAQVIFNRTLSSIKFITGDNEELNLVIY